MHDVKFKIGDKVLCVETSSVYEDHITPGNVYEITDVDWHFPNKICVITDNIIRMNKEGIKHGLGGIFIPDKYFSKQAHIRNDKLEKLDIK